MAFNQVTPTSLTPSRPAPAAPGRNGQGGYGSTFAVGTSSPSGSTYGGSYSGVGGSPNRESDSVSSAQVVRCGIVSVKEDGLVSWLWRPKWLVLKEQSLSIHKSEVRTCHGSSTSRRIAESELFFTRVPCTRTVPLIALAVLPPRGPAARDARVVRVAQTQGEHSISASHAVHRT